MNLSCAYPNAQHYDSPLAANQGLPSKRGVAQPGRALALGARSRQFESGRPDHLTFRVVPIHPVLPHGESRPAPSQGRSDENLAAGLQFERGGSGHDLHRITKCQPAWPLAIWPPRPSHFPTIFRISARRRATTSGFSEKRLVLSALSSPR